MGTESSAAMSASELTPNPPTDSHYFPKLPKELQLMIWKNAAGSPESKTLIVPSTPGFQPMTGYVSPPLDVQYHISPLLGACVDSRKEALKHYEVTDFEGRFAMPVYFRTADTLLFPDPDALLQFLDYRSPGDEFSSRSLVRHIEVHSLHALPHMPSLKMLVVSCRLKSLENFVFAHPDYAADTASGVPVYNITVKAHFDFCWTVSTHTQTVVDQVIVRIPIPNMDLTATPEMIEDMKKRTATLQQPQP